MTEFREVMATLRMYLAEHNIAAKGLRLEITLPHYSQVSQLERQILTELKPFDRMPGYGNYRVIELEGVQITIGEYERPKWPK